MRGIKKEPSRSSPFALDSELGLKRNCVRIKMREFRHDGETST